MEDDDELVEGKERVAYYWNDLDKAGEGEMEEFESLFENRIDKISQTIQEELDSGCDRAYILSDHGFVSLPESPDLDDIYPPDEANHVTRRWVAGTDLPEDGDGVVVDEDTQLGYIGESTEIRVLADPIQRFRNQGLSDAKFYHGGALPQEFVLNFITITQE
jgi:hypothetical protein